MEPALGRKAQREPVNPPVNIPTRDLTKVRLSITSHSALSEIRYFENQGRAEHPESPPYIKHGETPKFQRIYENSFKGGENRAF